MNTFLLENYNILSLAIFIVKSENKKNCLFILRYFKNWKEKFIKSLTVYHFIYLLFKIISIILDAGSFLKVHTINGDIVGTVKLVENITAVCYSTAPEGTSVNVIATGLDNGIIQYVFFFPWDYFFN